MAEWFAEVIQGEGRLVDTNTWTKPRVLGAAKTSDLATATLTFKQR